MSYINTLQWKKNRRFGDSHGGRYRLKLSDNIFARCHSLKRPNPADELPILLEDNPSREFFHPISAVEARDAMQSLPDVDWQGITHIWCRRVKQTDWMSGERPFAEFICGSGVKVIVLYAWPVSMECTWSRRPSGRTVNEFLRCGIQLHKRKNRFYISPNLKQLKMFYVQTLLFHEIGHHVDYYNRHWSSANFKKAEEFADQYAMQMTDQASRFLNNLKPIND